MENEPDGDMIREQGLGYWVSVREGMFEDLHGLPQGGGRGLMWCGARTRFCIRGIGKRWWGGGEGLIGCW